CIWVNLVKNRGTRIDRVVSRWGRQRRRGHPAWRYPAPTAAHFVGLQQRRAGTTIERWPWGSSRLGRTSREWVDTSFHLEMHQMRRSHIGLGLAAAVLALSLGADRANAQQTYGYGSPQTPYASPQGGPPAAGCQPERIGCYVNVCPIPCMNTQAGAQL